MCSWWKFFVLEFLWIVPACGKIYPIVPFLTVSFGYMEKERSMAGARQSRKIVSEMEKIEQPSASVDFLVTPSCEFGFAFPINILNKL